MCQSILQQNQSNNRDIFILLIKFIMIVNDKYKIQSELGSGAFGKLYMGKHIYTGESVAKLQTDDGAMIFKMKREFLNYC